VRVDEILEASRELGFLGPGPVDAQVRHAQGFGDAFDGVPDAFVDLGSGGGVPGLVLAELWPGATAVLVDSSERRTDFLRDAVDSLGWGLRVEVVRARAEAFARAPGRRGSFGAVVARGFGPPAVTAECAAPLLRVSGRFVVSEPPDDADRWPVDGLALFGLEDAGVVEAGARFRVLVQRSLCPERYPRRVGIPAKRPLW
jgi:16S rRNA (guanine527-N7)-methyltransferase